MGGLVTMAVRRPIAALPGTSPKDEPPVVLPRDPAREAAERELSKPRYTDQEPSLFRQLIDWIWNQLAEFLGSLSGVAPGGWVGLTVIAGAVLLLIIALRLRLGAVRITASTKAPLFEERPRSAAEHRAAAELHAADLQWSEALQERLRGIVRDLEERAVLDPRPGRTADEAATEAGLALPEWATDLRAAARAFDEVTYADRPANQPAYLQVRDLDEAVRHTRSQPRAGAGQWRAP